MQNETIPEKKQRLIDAAIVLTLGQGYAGTTIDQLCAKAGVSKGTFFHYFSTKEDVFCAAMSLWSGSWDTILEDANFDRFPDPLDRLEHLFAVMQWAYMREGIPIGCVVGTIAQEVSGSNESVRQDCEFLFDNWLKKTRKLLVDAQEAHPEATPFDSDEVAFMMMSIVQGSMLVAKAKQDRNIVKVSVEHCRKYVLSLFGRD